MRRPRGKTKARRKRDPLRKLGRSVLTWMRARLAGPPVPPGPAGAPGPPGPPALPAIVPPRARLPDSVLKGDSPATEAAPDDPTRRQHVSAFVIRRWLELTIMGLLYLLFHMGGELWVPEWSAPGRPMLLAGVGSASNLAAWMDGSGEEGAVDSGRICGDPITQMSSASIPADCKDLVTVTITPRRLESDEPELLASVTVEIPPEIKGGIVDPSMGGQRITYDQPAITADGRTVWILKPFYARDKLYVRLDFSWGNEILLLESSLEEVYRDQPDQRITLRKSNRPGDPVDRDSRSQDIRIPLCGSPLSFPQDQYMYSVMTTIQLQDRLKYDKPFDPIIATFFRSSLPVRTILDTRSRNNLDITVYKPVRVSNAKEADQFTSEFANICGDIGPKIFGIYSGSTKGKVERSGMAKMLTSSVIISFTVNLTIVILFAILMRDICVMDMDLVVGQAASIFALLQIRPIIVSPESQAYTHTDVTLVALFLLFQLFVAVELRMVAGKATVHDPVHAIAGSVLSTARQRLDRSETWQRVRQAFASRRRPRDHPDQ